MKWYSLLQNMVTLAHANNGSDFMQLHSPSRKATLKSHFQLHSIHEADRDDLQSVFESNTLRKKIFPDNVIVIETCVYEPMKANLDILLDPNVICAMYMTKDSTGHIESMSLGFKCSCELGLRYDINYYGPTNNVHLIISHFVQHFTGIEKEQSCYGGLWVNVLVSKKVCEGEAYQQLLLQRRRMGLVLANAYDREQIVYQQPLDNSTKSRL